MANKYVPEDLSLMEAACVHWVLSAIKDDVLSGTPSGRAIDRAMDEAFTIASTVS
ncbi:hypothetical protein [Corynebacterium rhinophilum]|uniref:hypothetical protein n=1 Tax=Corynebacterium rhinophilum TaxID=3050197 RepID=UPI00254CE926|nr:MULTISPECIES: hypothetical protein [unclassified Corynebacterium]MDK8646604.1 hypothetical protein [Corynebacterium sp. MSK082]MDK8697854.1 hypothetical protein [Corynebacterium sp. MSK192]